MEKEVIIAIIGAISVIGAALITSGIFQNGDEKYEIVEKPVSDDANDDKANEPPVNASLKPDKPSPQEAGTAIKWTATAEDREGNSLYYRFQLLNSSSTNGYRVVQDWSTRSGWEWIPAEAGNYTILVQVIDGHHADRSGSDDYRTESYVIVEKQAEKVIPAFFSEEDPAVAVSSWGEGRLDLFVRGTDGALYHRYGDGDTWRAWERLDEVLLTSAPAAVSRGPDTIDVFAIGEDNDLIYKRLEGSTWSGWESLDRPRNSALNSAPAVSSWDEDRLDVFVRGSDNASWHIWWDGSSWSGWESLGGHLTSAPAAASWDEGVIHLIIKEGEDDLKYKYYYDRSWSSTWKQVPIDFGSQDGIYFTSAPAVSAPVQSILNVFIRGEDNALCVGGVYGSIYPMSAAWLIWESFDAELTSAPTPYWYGNCTYVFAKGRDNTLMQGWYEFNQWSGSRRWVFESIGEWPPE